MLAALLPGLAVSSAGVAAVVGHSADETSAKVAAEMGVSLDGHVARQLDAEIGSAAGLILAMEPGHRAEIMRRYPQLSDRVMLFDQWTGGRGIADPYRKPEEFHREVICQIQTAATAWAARLKPSS